jgi:hypothetical protein
MNAKIDASSVQRLADRYPAALEAETNRILAPVLADLKSSVIRRTPVGATGRLQNSIYSEIQAGDGAVTGSVGTPLDYGAVVEFGRNPGSPPPVGPLTVWVRRKPGAGGSSAKSIAYAIALRLGTQPFRTYPRGAKMFSRAWNSRLPAITAALERLPEQVTKRLSQWR